MNVFEISNQILRLNKLIDTLICDIQAIRDSIAGVTVIIEQNEKSIFNFPGAKLNTRLRIENREKKQEILKFQRQMKEYERKLAKKKFLRQTKFATLPYSVTSVVTLQNSPAKPNTNEFDWDFVLKFVN